MVVDDVTNAELARRLDRFAADIHADLADVQRRLDAYVLREVHDAQQARQDDRMTRIERGMEDLRSFARWLIGGPVLAAVAVAVQLYLAFRGGGL